ncbi:Hypothetical predicted protein [Olea europaea subsp. europaea]|uniref:DUF1985 domain-containing protein n=1 Tax=Olea europaea subsp. europaea TaxID=158383 RepID=A0A8S0QIC3_OLEEU|nr:Hypothetical predicted protein [Olea europaea subsp. europaea]
MFFGSTLVICNIHSVELWTDYYRFICRNDEISILSAQKCTVARAHLATEQLEALVCRKIHCDKSHELWFNVQGHLTWFGLQEYAIITGLHTGSFSEGDRYTKALEKRRLKEKQPQANRYKLGLAIIVEGVITDPDNNVGIDEDTLFLMDDLERLLKGFRGTWARKMSDAKTKNEKDVSYTIHEFSIAMQILQLHVYATLRPTKAEHDLPYITNLVPYPDRSVQFLDDLARTPTSGGHDDSTAGDDHNDESGAGAEDDETSVSDDHQTPKDNSSKADESGDSSRDTSSETDAGDTEDDEDASRR